MTSKYSNPRVFFVTAGTLLLLFLLLGFSFTRSSPSSFHIASSKPSLHVGNSNSSDLHTDDLLQHASNATLGVSIPNLFLKELASASLRLTLLQFQKIFVINLRACYDHRESMSLAAALTGLQIEYIYGVTDVNRDYLPPGANEDGPVKGSLKAWRAHMNVLRK
jgi:hypothetical protein